MRAQGLFQIAEKQTIQPRLISCRVSHPGTGEIKDFMLAVIPEFSEIRMWYSLLPEILVMDGKLEYFTGEIVIPKNQFQPLYSKPSIYSDITEKVPSSSKLKILKIHETNHGVWLLVEPSSGNKCWIWEGWLNNQLSKRFWDEDMKKYYRYNKLGNRVYE